MCGIIGYIGKSKAVPYLLEGLTRLEYRGYDSSGIATVEKDGIRTIKTVGGPDFLKKEFAKCDESFSCIGIGHTRWATHGEVSKANCHPHLSKDGLFALVHNGIIENYAQLKKDLVRHGYSFSSQTDTEVVAHLLHKNYKGNFHGAVIKTLGMLEGSFALCILCRDFPDRIICARKGSPLVIGTGQKGIFVASDITALSENCEKAFTPDDGETVILTPDKALFYNKYAQETEKTPELISTKEKISGKNGYAHYMLKEIFEQPGAVRNTLSSIIKNGNIEFPFFSLTPQKAAEIKNIYIVACGSAYHVGASGKYILEKITGIPTHTDIASEFRYRNPPLTEKDLCIVISQSGETADSIAAIKEAKRKKVPVLSVVNVESSTIAKISNFVIFTKAGTEIAVATTKAYSAQLSVLYCLSVYIAALTGKIDKKTKSDFIKEILQLPEITELTLKKTFGAAKELSSLFAKKEHAYFIGRGTDYPIAMEGSLKMKEISYIHSEAYAAGELKHGTISLIEKGTVTVALMSDDNVLTKTLSNVKEVAARHGTILAIIPQKHKDKISELDKSILLPDCGQLTLPSVEVIPLQLLAYFTALERNCEIDKPRNLAKSVTVE